MNERSICARVDRAQIEADGTDRSVDRLDGNVEFGVDVEHASRSPVSTGLPVSDCLPRFRQAGRIIFNR